MEIENVQCEEEENTPDRWEDRWKDESVGQKWTRKPTPVVRKPVNVKNWFGNSSSLEESESEMEKWSEVERRKKGEEKRRKAVRRKENLKRECTTRASTMFSIDQSLANQ